MQRQFMPQQRKLRKNLAGSKFPTLFTIKPFGFKQLLSDIIWFKLLFRAKYGVEEMCRDQWNWANNNPWGYQKKR